MEKRDPNSQMEGVFFIFTQRNTDYWEFWIAMSKQFLPKQFIHSMLTDSITFQVNKLFYWLQSGTHGMFLKITNVKSSRMMLQFRSMSPCIDLVPSPRSSTRLWQLLTLDLWRMFFQALKRKPQQFHRAKHQQSSLLWCLIGYLSSTFNC